MARPSRERDPVELLEELSIKDDNSADKSDSKRVPSAYLTPLQHALVYELTTRRQRIAKAQQRIDFWRERDAVVQAEQDPSNTTYASTSSGWRGRIGDQFGADVVDEAFLDDLIRQRKARLAEVRQAQRLKEAIVESTDAAHAINASMAAVRPGPFAAAAEGSSLKRQTPLCIHSDLSLDRQPLRSIVARRDQLALEFLHVDEQIKHMRTERRKMAQQINAVRQITSKLVREVKEEKRALAEQREADISTSVARDGEQGVQRRIERLQEGLQTARSKREMVKGVLRGVVLESGLDWFGNRELRALVLTLGDEDLNTSDDEDVNLFSDDEEDDDRQSSDDEVRDT